jgi:hypothetical protein
MPARSSRLLFHIATATALFFPLSLAGQAAGDGDEAAIRTARKAQNHVIATGQLDSAATFWVRDIAIIAGLGVALQGRDVLQAAFAADSGVVYERITTKVEVSPHWPIAWEEGTWTGRNARSTTPPLVTGRYSAQWRKVNGRWLIRAEQFVALTCTAQACRWPLATTGP